MDPSILSNRFEIKDCLKKDEFSAVYRARQLSSGKEVVLKILETTGLEDQTVVKRFRREANILRGLAHPNLIQVVDFGTAESLFFISFEFFPGSSLRRRLKQPEFLLDKKLMLARQLMSGLDYAHQHQIVHRDIKPENILVDDDGLLKIVDFGLAMLTNEEKVTQGNAIVGTPGYMSPEQIQGQRVTIQSDLFSSGLVIYELFAGKMLFSGSDIGETLNNILRVNSATVSEAVSDLPAPMPQVLPSLLEKNPANRPDTAGEILSRYFPEADLNPIQKASIWQFRPAMIIAAIFALMLFSTAVFYAFQSKDTGQLSQNNVAPASKTSEPDSLTMTADSEAVSPVNRPAVRVAAIPEPERPAEDPLPENASLLITTLPQARVLLDARDISGLGQGGPLLVPPGAHRLEIQHDDFPHYETIIDVQAGEETKLTFELDKLFGYLDCKVHPWADIYLNGIHYGQTPLRELLMLNPGTYQLELRNPGFSSHQQEITIEKQDTLSVKAVLQ